MFGRRSLLLLPAFAASLAGAELTGYISDAACGWNNARSTKEAKECAQKCVRAGWAPVFIRDGDTNAYAIGASDKSKVMGLVGEHVSITGSLGRSTPGTDTKANETVTIKAIRKLTK